MATLAGERANGGWGLWLGWVAASFVGLVLIVPGFVVAGAVYVALGGGGPANVAAAAVHGALVGVAVGLLQGLALRRQIVGVGWWVAATIGGFVASFAAGAALGLPDLVHSAVIAATVAALQWLVLRRQVERAGWWLVGGGAGYFAGMGVADVAGPAAGVAAAAVALALAGWLLVWLLRRPARAATGRPDPEAEAARSYHPAG